MSINPAKIFVGAFLLDEIVGKILASGTGGDKTKIAARATEALEIVTGFNEILNGDPADGVNQITAAVSGASNLQPYEAMAIQNLAALAAQQLALVQGVAGGTILGQAATAIAGNVIAEIERVCANEGGVLPAAPTVPTAATAAAAATAASNSAIAAAAAAKAASGTGPA
jgi:hypothetical protein